MPFNKNMQTASVVSAGDDDLTCGSKPQHDMPAIPPPAKDEFADTLQSLIARSDKDLRIAYAGLFQAVLQSGPTWSANLVKDLDDWHRIVEAEVDYYMRRVLEKSAR